jgi:hypothetical protein
MSDDRNSTTAHRCSLEVMRNSDGVVHADPDAGSWSCDGPDDYLWEEGNFACDCNRHLFFGRAVGREPTDHVQCGMELYSVRLTAVDGTVVYEDGRFENHD